MAAGHAADGMAGPCATGPASALTRISGRSFSRRNADVRAVTLPDPKADRTSCGIIDEYSRRKTRLALRVPDAKYRLAQAQVRMRMGGAIQSACSKSNVTIFETILVRRRKQARDLCTRQRAQSENPRIERSKEPHMRLFLIFLCLLPVRAARKAGGLSKKIEKAPGTRTDLSARTGEVTKGSRCNYF
jgi:hypothetical protein